jgi:hypothetical protein
MKSGTLLVALRASAETPQSTLELTLACPPIRLKRIRNGLQMFHALRVRTLNAQSHALTRWLGIEHYVHSTGFLYFVQKSELRRARNIRLC